ncbi:MAG: hypothetical protein HYU28_07075 [Actinobacteria bacterium]|nr:hypothetical protein [Actinomycetota bacterium]
MSDRQHRAESMSRKTLVGGRFSCVVAVIGIVTSALAFVPGRADAHLGSELENVFREIAHIKRLPTDGTINSVFGVGPAVGANTVGGQGNDQCGGFPIVSEAMGRLYQPYALTNGRVGFLVRDLKSLAVEGGVLMPAGIKSVQWFAQCKDRGSVLHATDPATRRMWLYTVARQNPNAVTDEDKHQGMIVIREADRLSDYQITYKPLGISLNDINTDQIAQQVVDDALDFVEDPRLNNLPGIPDPNQYLGDPRIVNLGEINQDPYEPQGLTYTHGELHAVLSLRETTEDAPLPTRLVVFDPDTIEIKIDRVVRSCPREYPQQAGGGKAAGSVPVIRTTDSLWLPCLSSGNPLIVKIPVSTLADPSGTETTFTGTGVPFAYLGDPGAGRFHVRVQAPQGPALLSFDVNREIFVGLNAVGQGGSFPPTSLGIDSRTGRVYVQSAAGLKQGLARIDGRTPKVGSALNFEQLPAGPGDKLPKTLSRDPINGRLFALNGAQAANQQEWVVLEDDPPAEPPPAEDPDRTFQLDESPGLTGVNYSGEANGYGFRQLLVGGLTGVVPNRLSGSQSINPNTVERPNCYFRDRDLSLGEVSTAKISNSGFGATAIAVDADEGTRLDIQYPERCAVIPDNGLQHVPTPEEAAALIKETYRDAFRNSGWLVNILDQWVGNTLDGAVRTLDNTVNGEDTNGDGVDDNPGVLDRLDPARQPWYFGEATCRPDSPSNTAEATGAAAPLLANFEATVNCTNPKAVTAMARSEAPNVPPLPDQTDAVTGLLPQTQQAVDTVEGAASTISVASATSWNTTYLDPQRGTVSRSESLVRGVTIAVPGRGTIFIGGVHAVAEAFAKGRTNSNGTTYQRTFWGVRAVFPNGEVNCQLCRSDDDIRPLIDAINRGLGASGTVRLPRQDTALRTGTPKGYQAAVQRHPDDIINNQVLNGDSNLAAPALEIMLFNDSINWGRQRQIFQFAGTLANSQYGIICVKGQPQGSTCVERPKDPGSLAIALTDGNKRPLGGGEFTVSGPTPASCTTDGGGRCTMTNLQPGSYVVSEKKTPNGYLKAPDLKVTMGSFAQTVNVVNLKNEAFIEITLADAQSGAPLPGGVFEVVTDSDGNGTVGPKEGVTASCTTDPAGDCILGGPATTPKGFPLGKYIVAQKRAPDGYQVVDSVAFELALPGDIARLAFTNGRGAGPVVLALDKGNALPIATVDTPAPPTGGFFGPVSDALRWALRHPMQALVLGATLGMLGSPLWASWRRRLLIWASAA